MIVATVPSATPGHAHAAQELAPSPCPTMAARGAEDTFISKSAIETRHPLGALGLSFPDASRSSTEIGVHWPTRNGMLRGTRVTVHAAAARSAVADAGVPIAGRGVAGRRATVSPAGLSAHLLSRR